ncbi:MAG: D-glycero-beta-D-manno-heptose-7-phosphate kinase [Candidatus Omnitrophota bacterium]|nr:D-glycero-beta-D-manno-heptose-7-phosphate kinase [Candidatus Omnitrophota bacterium]
MPDYKKIISKFNKANILVVGDLILDEFIWGSVDRISPEAPVPVVLQSKRSYMPGGAANVANNLKSLGAKVSIVGMVGGDAEGKMLLAELHKRGINSEGILIDKKYPTIVKTRIIAQHQQVVRVDRENTNSGIDPSKGIADFILKNITRFDALIIEDYGKGVISPQLLAKICPAARKLNKIITVDPKEEHFDYYKGATAITPNRKETENAIRHLKIKDTKNDFKLNIAHLSTEQDIESAGKELLRYLDLKAVLITLGERGIRLFEKGKPKSVHIDTVAQEVFDVSGAGDTVIATLTLSLASGADMLTAAHLANFAAGIVVGKVGVATVNQQELLERISSK